MNQIQIKLHRTVNSIESNDKSLKNKNVNCPNLSWILNRSAVNQNRNNDNNEVYENRKIIQIIKHIKQKETTI